MLKVLVYLFSEHFLTKEVRLPYRIFNNCFLKEKSEDLATSVSLTAIFVRDDTGRSGEDNMTELTRWEKVSLPFFHIVDGDVVTWGDNSALVDSSVQVHDDFTAAMVVNFFEFSNVSGLLHTTKKSDDDFNGRADKNLTFTAFLGVRDALK